MPMYLFTRVPSQVSYHGVKNNDVFESILVHGQLMKPGDKLLSGDTLSSTKCGLRQDQVMARTGTPTLYPKPGLNTNTS